MRVYGLPIERSLQTSVTTVPPVTAEGTQATGLDHPSDLFIFIELMLQNFNLFSSFEERYKNTLSMEEGARVGSGT